MIITVLVFRFSPLATSSFLKRGAIDTDPQRQILPRNDDAPILLRRISASPYHENKCVPLVFLCWTCYFLAVTTRSTRRLIERPCAVSLEAIGMDSP